MNSSKAQASVEYIVIVMAFLALLGFLSYSSSWDSKAAVEEVTAREAVDSVAKAADTVYSLGPCSSTYVSVVFPYSTVNTSVAGREINLMLEVNGVAANVHALTLSNLTGSLPSTPGRHRIPVQLSCSGELIVGSTTTSTSTSSTSTSSTSTSITSTTSTSTTSTSVISTSSTTTSSTTSTIISSTTTTSTTSSTSTSSTSTTSSTTTTSTTTSTITTSTTTTSTSTTTTVGIPSDECDVYCEGIGYSRGSCISNSPTCRSQGGHMESGGNRYCQPAVCCCWT